MRENARRTVRPFSIAVAVFGLAFLTTLTLMLPSQNEHQLPKGYLAAASEMKVIVHLDLKGAPPKVSYYYPFFQMLAALRVDAVLMEYEDMFPYSGGLDVTRTADAYSADEIRELNALADKLGIKLIPLVQTFGHLEFVLKHSQFSHLSENPLQLNTICPSDDGSLELIDEMVRQIRALHPNQTEIHMGADEAWHIAEDQRCKNALAHKFNNSTDRLKLNHIANIAKIAKKHNFTRVYVWNDMFERMTEEQLREYQLDTLVVPVVWGYIVDVTRKGYFPDGMFEHYGKVFPEILFAGAYKGANGISMTFMESQRYLQNLISYHDLQHQFAESLDGKVHEIVLTGWQRYAHAHPLCELLPVGIPTLVAEVFYIRRWDEKVPSVSEEEVLKFLNCSVEPSQLDPIPFNGTFFHPPPEWKFLHCDFPGVGLYRAIEELRLARWKASIVPEAASEIPLLEPKLRGELSQIYNNRTVNEWITQNLYNILPA